MRNPRSGSLAARDGSDANGLKTPDDSKLNPVEDVRTGQSLALARDQWWEPVTRQSGSH